MDTTATPSISPNASMAQRNEDLAKVEIAVLSLIFGSAVISNSVVLVILLCVRRKKLNRVYLMMVHLTCADLFVAFFNVLTQLIEDSLGHSFGGNFTCKMVRYFQVVAMYASSYVLVSTAIDRYIAICHPLTSKTWTKSKMHAIVAAAWAFSLLFSVPQLIFFSHIELPSGHSMCGTNDYFAPQWAMQLYITSITFAIYIIPVIILTGAYGKICYTVWRSIRVREKRLQGSTNNVRAKGGSERSLLATSMKGSLVVRQQYTARTHQANKSSNSKLKTVKLTLTVIVCYMLCWGPFFVIQMWAAWDPKFVDTPATVIIFLLASLNSCTNPWIYLFFVDNSCGQLRKLIRRRNNASVRYHSSSGQSDLG